MWGNNWEFELGLVRQQELLRAADQARLARQARSGKNRTKPQWNRQWKMHVPRHRAV